MAIVLADVDITYRARGQIEKRGFADWFTKIYLPPPINGWCICDAIPGCGTNNNPLESVNKAIKQNVWFEKTPINLTRFIKSSNCEMF